MDDISQKSNLVAHTVSENDGYNEILFNLNELNLSSAAMYTTKDEYTTFEKAYTYEEIKNPILRSVISDHNYISSEDSYSRNIRQNLIDFVQLTNLSLTSESNDANISDTQVETLIDNVLILLSKVTDYEMTINKLNTVFSSKEKRSKNTNILETSKQDVLCKNESKIDKFPLCEEFKEVEYPREIIDCESKPQLSAFVKVEGESINNAIGLLSTKENENDEKGEILECKGGKDSVDDQAIVVNKQIEMILGKRGNVQTNQTQSKLNLINVEKSKDLTISKDELSKSKQSEISQSEVIEKNERKTSIVSKSRDKQPVNETCFNESHDLIRSKANVKELELAENSFSFDLRTSYNTPTEVNPEKTDEPFKLVEIVTSRENDSILTSSVNTSYSSLSIIKLLKFADQLKQDCLNFSEKSETSIEDFLSAKLRDHKSIVASILFKDSSIQTEKIISKKILCKINASDKRHLLESSNDSDSSNFSVMDKTLNELHSEYKNSSKQYFSASPKSAKKSLTPKKSSKASKHFRVYSEDSDEDIISLKRGFNSFSRHESVDLEQLTDAETANEEKIKTLESISHEGYSSSSSLSSSLSSSSKSERWNNVKSDKKNLEKSANESDKENRDSITSSESCESKKSKLDVNIEDDPQEKEIERLLNLKGLIEPQKNTNSNNHSKQKSSSKLFSSKGDSLYDVMQEIDVNSMSDDSTGDDSENILTEKQFLAKCNESLKKQLLESGSSDSEISTNNEDLELINKIISNSSDDDNQCVSYVDKFLENLYDEEGKSKSPIPDDNVSKTESPNRIEVKKLSVDVSPYKNDILIDEADNSITFLRVATDKKKKEKKEKSFESILAQDNHQRHLKMKDDLIELSAESSNSDIEEISAEEKERNLRIKPMLRHDQLESETINAQKKEADRLRRLEKRSNFLTKLLKTKNENIDENDLVLDYASSTKKFIKVHTEIAKHLKPHQRDGVKFMYDSCYGAVDSLKENSGSGCILAHCMGLGKTLQVIALLHTVTSYKELKTSKILVLCPKSTIMNWADEIKRWLGPLDLKSLQIFNFSDTADVYDKINVLRKWASVSQKSGCLIMGYEAFRSLVFFNTSKTKTKSNIRVEDIRENIHKYLLKPGADLVVCDEGHIIKNRKSGISLAAAEIITPKRIILTGTPIQNNLKEYYSMVNFIKPLILGTEKEFANLYANPIKNGQHKDSSKRDIKVMKQRSFVLHKKLSKFVQRKEAELLKSFLPQKFEYVLFIPMTDVQNTLYEYVLNAISKREDSRGKSLIPDYTCLRKIWTHPKVLEDAWKNAITTKNKKEFKRLTSNNIGHSEDDQPDDIYDSQTGVISVQSDWWRDLVTESDLESILPSNKLKTMFEIIRMAEENNEKCLIFTAFVAVLNVVEYFFHKINDKQRDFFMYDTRKLTGHWINGQDYYRLDGKTNKTLRHEMVKRFNDPKNKRTRVFLISAKAGGQGINLIGANRVIILDTSWNPANDQQNIFRIFRLGQKKNCYVYRLIAMGTMEEKVYSRSVTKQAMSFRVVDEQQIDRHYNMAELAELYTLTKPNYSERPVPVFPQDQILANLLLNSPELVYKYHEHDSLLENKMEQELSEQEKADAWVAYERDLQMNSEPKDIMEGFQRYPLFGQGNYIYPMHDFEHKSFITDNYDPSQMDLASRNPLATSMLPNYVNNSNLNRNSYLDILNMYKNLSSTLLGDKSVRPPLYNSNYGMPLGAGLINNSAILTSDSPLSGLTNPFYPYTNSSLNPNTLLSNANLSSSNLMNSNRYDQSNNIIKPDHSFSLRNSFPTQMSSPYTKDLTGRSTISKNIQSQNVTGPSPQSPILQPTNNRSMSQNIYNTRETIPTSIISKKLGKVQKITAPSSITKSSQYNSTLLLDTSGSSIKTKTANSVPRTASPIQAIIIDDSPAKQKPVSSLPVNMGIVYPKTISFPLSPISEIVEAGSNLNKPGSSMQIIRTDSPIQDSVRKKFDNISPNISLTAVRTMTQKTSQSEKSPILSSNSDILLSPEGTYSNIRKRRNSLENSLAVNLLEQPKKVVKYNLN